MNLINREQLFNYVFEIDFIVFIKEKNTSRARFHKKMPTLIVE